MDDVASIIRGVLPWVVLRRLPEQNGHSPRPPRCRAHPERIRLPRVTLRHLTQEPEVCNAIGADLAGGVNQSVGGTRFKNLGCKTRLMRGESVSGAPLLQRAFQALRKLHVVPFQHPPPHRRLHIRCRNRLPLDHRPDLDLLPQFLEDIRLILGSYKLRSPRYRMASYSMHEGLQEQRQVRYARRVIGWHVTRCVSQVTYARRVVRQHFARYARFGNLADDVAS